MDELARQKTFAEFFAGIGLVHEALRPSGWQCVFANDVDPKKHEIYNAHFQECSHFHLGDVWDTKEVVGRIPEKPFLATASFPCIDLSLAGHWRGLDGNHSSAFFGFVQVIDALESDKPRAILIENVVGFLTSNSGADFACATTILADQGYWLDAFVVDARHFVPQSRPRVFVLGVDEQLKDAWLGRRTAQSLIANACELGLSESSLRPKSLISLIRSTPISTGWLGLDLPSPPAQRQDLSALIDTDDGQLWWDEQAVDKHYHMMSDRHREFVDGLINGGGVHIGTIFRRKRHGKMRAEVRFDGLAGCLRTPRGGSARQIVIVVNGGKLRMRWMSPREYARLMGAEDYPILDKVNQMLFGFGDAVCVPVVEWIDQNLLTPAFESATREKPTGVAVAG